MDKPKLFKVLYTKPMPPDKRQHITLVMNHNGEETAIITKPLTSDDFDDMTRLCNHFNDIYELGYRTGRAASALRIQP